ncbi:FmdB family zinc ribbon protein [Rhodococcus kronopolitis]|uniref:FmdB family zinc ribbon protein n=1 Tax=Rhodococcus kronopolitis TaxID=1460226 RepID=A0ABV9FNF9_9NOCA
MPTYSYACTECSNRFDIVQSFTEDSLTVCSECSGKLRKLFNSVGIVFKGSGFYRTDSRGGSSTASEPAAKSDASATKSESKPAAAPAAAPTAAAAS